MKTEKMGRLLVRNSLEGVLIDRFGKEESSTLSTCIAEFYKEVRIFCDKNCFFMPAEEKVVIDKGKVLMEMEYLIREQCV